MASPLWLFSGFEEMAFGEQNICMKNTEINVLV
jgi:hypothetical protein